MGLIQPRLIEIIGIRQSIIYGQHKNTVCRKTEILIRFKIHTPFNLLSFFNLIKRE